MLHIVIEQSETFESYLGRLWHDSGDRKHDQDRTKGIQKEGFISVTTIKRSQQHEARHTKLYPDKRKQDRG